MNAMTATAADLPTILDHRNGLLVRRREHVQDFCLGQGELDRFNDLLARLGRKDSPLDRDQLATAARELSDSNMPDVAPPCIDERMRRVDPLTRMIGSRDWTPVNDAIDVATTVVEYVRRDDDLIPDRLRRVGRLDDAIVIETAWPRLAAEVASYLDYCRLHLVEASLRGLGATSFRFTRSDWEAARAAEATLEAQLRRIRTHSYLPAAAANLFQIH
ncbi:MAG TPA: hypothetical protein VK827_07335 [Lysobacter sp.]|nr:hypothetical protein [Lysobacter sp.]